MNEALPDPADVPEAGKARAALGRFAITRIESSKDPSFELAWRALSPEFGPRGELERREVIEGWLDRGARRDPGRLPFAGGDGSLLHRYHLLVARDADGTFAGVRDCHVTVDPEHRIAIAYLAHTLVLDGFRRSGLAALLRAAPVTLARALVALAGEPSSTEILLAAEMEPADPSEPATVTRLVAYGDAGFAAIAPLHLPYCQPDFRDLATLGGEAEPLPLLPIVRWIGHEGARDLPRELADAFVTHLYAVFATHGRPEDLRGPLVRARQTLAGAGLERIPLLPLPTGPSDVDALAPLLRSTVLPFHTHGPEAHRHVTAEDRDPAPPR